MKPTIIYRPGKGVVSKAPKKVALPAPKPEPPAAETAESILARHRAKTLARVRKHRALAKTQAADAPK